jgi:hypothetical protein
MGELYDGLRVNVPNAESGETGAGEWIIKPVDKVCGSWRKEEWDLIFVPAEEGGRGGGGNGWLMSGERVGVRYSSNGYEGDGEWVVEQVEKYCANWRTPEWELVWTPWVYKPSTTNSNPRPRRRSTVSAKVPAKKAAAKRAPAKKAAAKVPAKSNGNKRSAA